MSQMDTLIRGVAIARKNFIANVFGLTNDQTTFRSSPETWSIIDNIEHMFWAEFGGINGMWKAIDRIKNNKPVFSGESIHHGLTVEQIIGKTWKEKEEVPETAKPRWGGNLFFWIASLESCQPLLLQLNDVLGDIDPEKVIHPHPISGPMNMLQRLEFLRFHLQRHQEQVDRIKSDPAFPATR
jgi:hypothetical protein